jgi:hypothetical protein
MEGLTLSLMSTLLCFLTFLGALGVEPPSHSNATTQQQQGRIK